MKNEYVGGFDLAQKIRDTHANYLSHPEKYPFRVVIFSKLPDQIPYRYGITNVPGTMLNTIINDNIYKALINVQEGEDPKGAFEVAKELAGLMNKANGHNHVLQ